MSETGDQHAAVTGYPVSHSLSPLIMSQWINAAGLDAVYDKIEIPPNDAAQSFQILARSGMVGVNVTMPHKELVLDISHSVTDRARRVGAANRLVFRNGEIHADNTDVPGYQVGLKDAGIVDRPDSVLILGAGGAARAILCGYLEAGVDRILISNRTRERAETLAKDLCPNAKIIDWDNRSDATRTVGHVVNVTALGLNGKGELGIDFIAVRSDLVVIDTVYAPLNTRFLQAAHSSGLRTVDGLRMLVGQARPSFEAFFGVSVPQLDPRPALIEALGEQT